MNPMPLLTAAHKTVDIFAGIVKRPLSLKNGKLSRTNGKEITVPFKHPDFYLLVERQLSHILFRSDPAARAWFVKSFIASVEKLSTKHAVKDTDRDQIQVVIERVIDILESRRIESLWGLLYPGSYQRMRVRQQTDAARLVSRAHDCFFDFLVCLDAGLEVPPGPMDRVRSIFETALHRVERRSFTASLVMARWLVTQLVDDLLRQDRNGYRTEKDGDGRGKRVGGHDFVDDEGEGDEAPVKATVRQRMMALQSIAHQFGQLDAKVEVHYNDYERSRGDWAMLADSTSAAGTALQLDLHDEGKFEGVLGQSETEMQTLLDGVQKQLSETMSSDEWLKRDPDCHIEFIDVRPDDFDAKPLSFTKLSALDHSHISQLRTRFFRVIGRRSTKLEDCGSEIDPQAYLEARTTGLPIPFFRQEVRGRGFRAFLLIDRSLSMRGSRIDQAERATRMLMDALDFPFVELSVWGFSAPDDGKVTITRFSPLLETFHTTKSPVDGGTPLHIALRVALRDLSEGSEVKHLIILTDGAPMYAGSNHRLIAESQLRLFVREQVQEARRHGIHVTALLVGDRDPQGHINFDVSAKNLQFMFGSERYWKCVDERRLGEDLVQAVTSSFLSYLTH